MPAKTRRTRASNHVAWPSPTQSLFGGDSSKARRDQRQDAQSSRGKRRVVISLSPTPPPQTPQRARRSHGSGSNGGSRDTAIPVEDDEDEQGDTSDWEPETPPLPPTQGETVPSKLSVDAEGADDDDDDDDDDEDDFSTPPPPPGQEPAHSPPPQPSPPASPPPVSPSPPPSEAAAEGEGEASDASEEESEASASPEPQEPRKSIFDIHDQEEEDAMLAQLQALLPGSDEEASDSDDDDMDYEEKRNRRMMKNKAMLLQLGLAASQPEERSNRASPSARASPALREEMASQTAPADEDDDDNHGEGPSTLKTADNAPRKKRGRPSRAEKAAERASGRVVNKNNARTQLRLAEDGTTTSLPLRGTTHELAYVYLPPPRARDPFVMIDNFLVEAPRPPTPPPPSPSPSPPPVKMRKLAKKMGKRKAVDADGVEKPVKRRKRERERDVAAADGEAKPSAPLAAAAASAYSTNEGVNCHQCRRKHASPLPMTCRKCRLHYCYGCMDVRYGAYDPSDPDDALYDNCRDTWNSKDTHWRCPKCRGICNCSLCLVKGGYKELLHGPGAKTAAAAAGEKGPAVKKRVTSLSTNTRGPKKEREHRSVRHYLENALGVFKTNKEGTGEDDVAVASDEEGVGPAELPTIAEDGDGAGDGGGRVRHPLRKLPKRGYMTLKRLEEQIAAVKLQLREERAKMSSRKVAMILVGVDDYSDAEEGGEEQGTGLVQPPRRRLTLRLPEHRLAADEEEDESDADGEDDVTAAAIFAATQGPSLFSSSAATEANVWVRSAMDVSDSESDDLMEPDGEEAYGRRDDDDADGDDEEEEEESEDELMDSDDEDEDEGEDDDDEVAEDGRRSLSHSVRDARSRRASAASSILSSASSGLSDPPSLSPLSSRRPSPISPPPPKPKRLTGRAKSKASWAAPAAAADQNIDSSMDEGDDGQPLVESYGHGNGDDTPQQQQQQQRYKLLPIPAPIPSSLRPLNTTEATSSPMHSGVASQLQQPSTPGSSSHDEAEIRTRAGTRTRTRGRMQPTFGWA